jgi:hypothetical protein
MICFLFCLLSLTPLQSAESEPENISQNLSSTSRIENGWASLIHVLYDGPLHLGASAVFGSASLLARIGWGASFLSPWASTIGNECLLLSHLFGSATYHILSHWLKGPLSGSSLSYSSWHENQELLSHVPVDSDHDKKLLQFLERRWLAKSTGFFPSIVHWVCPCFGVALQVHPETSSFYARSPWIKISAAYQNRVDAWKQALPHPHAFPLILTRPTKIHEYLPSCIRPASQEEISDAIIQAVFNIHSADSKVVLDLTDILDRTHDKAEWKQQWGNIEAQLIHASKHDKINLSQILCVQSIQQEGIGGIRLLLPSSLSAKESDAQYVFLLDWVSNFGISANRIELDRCPSIASQTSQPSLLCIQPSKEAFLSYLSSYESNWKSAHPQKTLLLKGILQTLKGLLSALPEEKWDEILKNSTRSTAVHLYLLKIQKQLDALAQEKDRLSFFEMASQIDQVHAGLSSLLEILSPYTARDFPQIYLNLLTCISHHLTPLTQCGIHTSGMTSLTGIFKAVEKMKGRRPRVIFGENTYYECIGAAQKASDAIYITEAKEEDWKTIDLILAEFNPVLRRIELQPTEYKIERISDSLRKALSQRQDDPLTLALDCTFDYIDSPKVKELLEEFQNEIKAGRLNIIGYRSGLKFDLFGMDNFCGAPFFMIHNDDPKWASFEALLTDPVLLTDHLSLNWFCLAYKYAAPELELYRKQIFDNTRALINRVPSRLLHDKQARYRIVPMEEGAELAFIDMKISGSFHQLRGALLAAGCLYTKCMEGGHPIFYRLSVGFYHPNFTMLFSEEHTTIRLTLGLDPAQVDLFVDCFEAIDALNGSSSQTLLDTLAKKLSLSHLSQDKTLPSSL